MSRVYNPADWYWNVADGPSGGMVYASARFAYVPAASDAQYLAFLADENIATVIDTEAHLRDVLEAADVAFLDFSMRARELLRPEVHVARARLSATVAAPTAVALRVRWAAGGFDPRDMHNPTGPAPDQIVIPAAQEGTYLCLATARFAANAVGIRGVQIQLDGAEVVGTQVPAASVGVTSIQAVDWVELPAGGIITVRVRQTSGGTLSVDAALKLLRTE